MLESAGAAVKVSRGALPIWPFAPMVPPLLKSMTAPLSAVRPSEAKISSAELTPVPPAET